MCVLRALHYFAVQLGDRKPDKSHLQPELARAANDSLRCNAGKNKSLLLSIKDV